MATNAQRGGGKDGQKYHRYRLGDETWDRNLTRMRESLDELAIIIEQQKRPAIEPRIVLRPVTYQWLDRKRKPTVLVFPFTLLAAMVDSVFFALDRASAWIVRQGIPKAIAFMRRILYPQK
jgi:hypothetical protein